MSFSLILEGLLRRRSGPISSDGLNAMNVQSYPCPGCGTVNKIAESSQRKSIAEVGGKFVCISCKMLVVVPSASTTALLKRPDTASLQSADSSRFTAEQRDENGNGPPQSETATPPTTGRQKTGEHPVPLQQKTGEHSVPAQRKTGEHSVPAQRKTGEHPVAPRYETGQHPAHPAATTGKHPIPTMSNAGEHKIIDGRRSSWFALEKNEVLIFAIVVLLLIVLLFAVAQVSPGNRFFVCAGLLVMGSLLVIGGNAIVADVAYQQAPKQGKLCKYIPFYSVIFCLVNWKRMNCQQIIYFCGIVSVIASCTVYTTWTPPSLPNSRALAIPKLKTKTLAKVPTPQPYTFDVSFNRDGYSLTMHVLGTKFEEGRQIDLSSIVKGSSAGSTFEWSVFKVGVESPFDWSEDPKSDFFSFTPDDNGRYRIVLAATDSSGNKRAVEQTIDVANVSPTAKISSISTPTREGSAIRVSGEASDPAGTNDTLTYEWAVYKDGSSTPVEKAEGVDAEEFTFTPGDNGRYLVVLRVSDEDGGTTTVEKAVNVDNVPPHPSLVSVSSVRREGSPISVKAKAIDPAGKNDTLTYEWGVFKNESETPFHTAKGVDLDRFTFTPDDDGRYRVVLTVSDEDGGSESVEAAVEVANVAPTPEIVSISPEWREGTPIRVEAKATDPAGPRDTLTYNWSVTIDDSSDPVEQKTGVDLTQFTFTPKDNGRFRIALRVSDEDGGVTGVEQTIEVKNAAPEVRITAPAPEVAFPVGTRIQFKGEFSDAGSLDTHNGLWTFKPLPAGDAIDVAATVKESAGNGTALCTRAFDTPALYRVKLTVTDKDLGQASAIQVGGKDATFIVFEPGSGPVIGEGRSPVPPRALSRNPNASSTATLAFKAGYDKGANVPTGQLSFQLDGLDLDFQSKRLDWLIVKKSRAELKGIGTVNGAGAFGFRLTLWDGSGSGGDSSDRFRIRIWDDSDARVIYDHEPGVPADAEPAGTFSSGSITITQRP